MGKSTTAPLVLMLFLALSPLPFTSFAEAPITKEAMLLRGGHLHSFAFLPEAREFLVGMHQGLYVSRDQGRTWSPLSPQVEREDIMGLATDAGSQTIYASGHDIGVYKSTDGGRSFRPMTKGLPHLDAHALGMSPKDPRIVYIWIVGYGFFRTSDGGLTWKAIEPRRGSMPLYSLAISPKDPNLLYAGTQAGIIISRDGGSTWEVLPDDLKGSQVFAIAVHPKGRELLAGTDRGLFVGREDGKGWVPLAYETEAGAVIAFAFDTLETGIVHALTHKGAIFKGSARSLRWERVN